jgi:hybrid cluster-associated redox disulfide protein
MTKDKITKEMKIDEVLKKYPETVEIFVKNGFHCIGCAVASLESIEDGARVHGIDTDKLVGELNAAIKEKK